MEARMKWKVERVITYRKGEILKDGYGQFGFHDSDGNRYVIHNQNHWIGCLSAEGALLWTMGPEDIEGSSKHRKADFKNPHFISSAPDGSLLLLCSGNKTIYKINPQSLEIETRMEMDVLGVKDIGNCVCDEQGHLWINEITGCRIWQLSAEGGLMRTVGNGEPGFNHECVPLDEARFQWIYDLRKGPDGNIYVLDSKNYAIRKIDPIRQTVSRVVGTGAGGYSGDGGDACHATLGMNPTAHFDGPWSMALDEEGNIFVGDTQNKVVRMVDKKTNRIHTIAGSVQIKDRDHTFHEKDPLSLQLSLISSMDYYDGRLFVPIWNNKLVILQKT